MRLRRRKYLRLVLGLMRQPGLVRAYALVAVGEVRGDERLDLLPRAHVADDLLDARDDLVRH